MKRVLLVPIAVMAAMLLATPAMAADGYTASGAVKLDVLSEWAHPDDDTSIIGPCGVWHQRYGTKCGSIMVTRGEGGGNAVGTEIGPALGLRRENEDRVAHFRSGTVDIFNLDRVDFFYNQSAPLTQAFWGQDETLRRITRIIRMTQPEIYIGFTPTLDAGHGNHQQAGRYIWEGVLAAADPAMFPEQLQGPNALSTWQVKKVFSGGATGGTGGTTTSPDCNTGFIPAGLDTVAGTWTGYDSPYRWPEGNVQGKLPGSPKSWAQVAREGTFAYPTQSRTMFKDVFPPGCSRFGMTDSFVPFQPNGTAGRGPGRGDPLRRRRQGPGRAAQGHARVPDVLALLQRAGRAVRGHAAPALRLRHARPGHRDAERAGGLEGLAALRSPSGRWVPVRRRRSTSPSRRTPSAAVEHQLQDLRRVRDGRRRRATPTTSSAWSRPPRAASSGGASGPSTTPGSTDTAPQARRLGRSAAIQSMGAGETITVPVDVHNWSLSSQSGDVSLDLPAGMASPDASKPYGPLPAGADTTVEFEVSNSFTNATLPGAGGDDAQATNVTIPITTSHGATDSTEDLTMSIVPTTEIEAEAAAPDVDGSEGAGEYTGEELDVGRKWEPGGSTRNCDPQGVDCGAGSIAKVSRFGDDLYFLVHVQDDFQSYAVKPAECVGHWQADSVELLIDPRGNASEQNRDTASTFKLGVFPYTNDPSGSNGNGPNGPCWSRDADNHQGYSTGPLARHGQRRAERPGRGGRDRRDVGRLQRHLGRPRLRGRRLHDRGQDPDGRPPRGGRPGSDRAEHHALRQRRQHGGDGLDACCAIRT